MEPTVDQSLLECALEIALRAHRGQLDRSGGPYVTHPLRMMSRAAGIDEQIVALLHDTVEDGGPNGVTFATLQEAGFPDRILDAVDALTRRTTSIEPERSRDETYEEFVERTAINGLARAVKLLDLKDNMDLTRLNAVGPEDATRLARYVRAWHRLADAR